MVESILPGEASGQLRVSRMPFMRETHRRASNGPGPFRHPRREISLSISVAAARLWVSTSRRAAMNDDLSHDAGPLGGLLCVFLALVILLIV